MIEKAICLPGNIFVVNNKVSVENDRYNKNPNNALLAHSTVAYKEIEIPVGTRVEIVTKPGQNVRFKVGNKTYWTWWNGFRVKVDQIEGQENVIPEETTRYKIYKGGKPLKPKYFKLNKIKNK